MPKVGASLETPVRLYSLGILRGLSKILTFVTKSLSKHRLEMKDIDTYVATEMSTQRRFRVSITFEESPGRRCYERLWVERVSDFFLKLANEFVGPLRE